ncbi:MAG: hypothetical protein M3302_06105 [Actinomycetota bacterium]|nr:hypothetical protein [Actinomycetota bacterium]
MSQYATYQVTELQVFFGAMDDLFLIAAALSALSALGALLLRSGPAPAAPGISGRSRKPRRQHQVNAAQPDRPRSWPTSGPTLPRENPDH